MIYLHLSENVSKPDNRNSRAIESFRKHCSILFIASSSSYQKCLSLKSFLNFFSGSKVFLMSFLFQPPRVFKITPTAVFSSSSAHWLTDCTRYSVDIKLQPYSCRRCIPIQLCTSAIMQITRSDHLRLMSSYTIVYVGQWICGGCETATGTVRWWDENIDGR